MTSLNGSRKLFWFLFVRSNSLNRCKYNRYIISLNGTPINQATSYEYLGIPLDNHLTTSLQIDKIYKGASKLLQRIRPNILPLVAEKIYSLMTRPVLLYCYLIYLSVGESAKKRLQSIQDSAHKIIALEVKSEFLRSHP